MENDIITIKTYLNSLSYALSNNIKKNSIRLRCILKIMRENMHACKKLQNCKIDKRYKHRRNLIFFLFNVFIKVSHTVKKL